MKNITYLLGAGASAFCMPVINNMRSRISYLLEKLEGFSDKKNNPDAYLEYGFKKEFQEEYDQLRAELIWLLEESEPHQTVDTLAKKYYHTDADSLLRLKRALIFYFLLEQLIDIQTGPIDFKNGNVYRKKDIPDKRYDSFIASVLMNEPGKVKIKSGIRFITWNYDMQFEMSFQKYFKNADAYIFHLQKYLQVLPSRRCIDDLSYYDQLNLNEFSLVKLNGQALFDNEDKNNYRTILNEVPRYEKDRLNHFFSYSRQMFQTDWKQKNLFKMFNFCWEHSSGAPAYAYAGLDRTMEFVKKIAEKTEILVVIGYSFPFFNRETDSFLINNMKSLQKVYIQDMPERVENLISVFKSSFQLPSPNNRKATVHPVSYVDSFFLPPEL